MRRQFLLCLAASLQLFVSLGNLLGIWDLNLSFWTQESLRESKNEWHLRTFSGPSALFHFGVSMDSSFFSFDLCSERMRSTNRSPTGPDSFRRCPVILAHLYQLFLLLLLMQDRHHLREKLFLHICLSSERPLQTVLGVH